MERLALLGPWDRVDANDLSFTRDSTLEKDAIPNGNPVLGRDEFDLSADGLNLEDLNRQVIMLALEKNQRNQTRTAQYLGISRRALQGRLKRMGLIQKPSP